MTTLTGVFAPVNAWTRISSPSEGRFMERIAPGAFTRTIAEDRDAVRCIFEHGMDPTTGMKPLGRITDLRETQRGGEYSVELLDADYVRSIVPGLEAGVYGSSFRFRLRKEQLVQYPGRSSTWNPKRLHERTILDLQVREVGPTAFPAAGNTSANVRSSSVRLAPNVSARIVDAPRELGVGPVPVSVRALRKAARGSPRAHDLIVALQRGARIQIEWEDEYSFSRGMVIPRGIDRGPLSGETLTSRGRLSSRLATPRHGGRHWRLDDPDDTGDGWRIEPARKPSYAL